MIHTSNFTWRGGHASLVGKPSTLNIWRHGLERMPVEAPCQVTAIQIQNLSPKVALDLLTGIPNGKSGKFIYHMKSK